MSKRWTVFVVLYPIVTAIVVLAIPWAWHHRGPAPSRPQAKASPSAPDQAVTAYWRAEDEAEQAWQSFGLVAPFRSRVSGRLWGQWEEDVYRYKDRVIEGSRQLGGGRWQLDATLWSRRKEEDPVHVAYVVTKEGGTWLVDEIRLQCPKCKGEKRVSCITCSGSGKRKDDYNVYSGWTYKTCDDCNGTGREECSRCEGKGYVELVPSQNPFDAASLSW